MSVTPDTHELIAAVIGDRAEFDVGWVHPNNFITMVNTRRNKGLRGFPMYAMAYGGAVYIWPINDGTARVFWRPRTWRRPL